MKNMMNWLVRLWPVGVMAANMAACIILFFLVLADVACRQASHQHGPQYSATILEDVR